MAGIKARHRNAPEREPRDSHDRRDFYPRLEAKEIMVDRTLTVLSFAKNTSAVMSLSGYALIAVMQTAELRDLDNLSDARDLPRKWTLLVEAQVGPRSVVISEIRSQGLLKMPSVQDHEMVQAVSSYRADQTFDVGILPGTPGCGQQLFDV